MIIYIIVIVLISIPTAILLYYVQFKIDQYRHTIRYKDGTPLPGPPPVFPFGNMLEIKKYGRPSVAIEEWRKIYGNEFQFWFGARSLLYVHNLEVMKSVCSLELPRFQTWTHREFWRTGIMMNHDPVHHKIHRNAALTRLMSVSYLRQIAQITTQKTDRLIEILLAQSNGKPLEVKTDKIVQSLVFDIIGQAAFSLDFDSIEGGGKYDEVYVRPLRTFLVGVAELSRVPQICKYIFLAKYKQVKQCCEKVDTFSIKILNERRQEKLKGISREDFMDYLVSEKDPRTNQYFSEDDIVRDIGDLLGAGHETTASSVSFALYYLSWNLDVQKTLQEECDKFPSSLSYEDSGRLAYTQAVMKETLRVQSAVETFMREVQQRTEINNIVVPEKSTFFFCVREFSHDPNYFAEPEKFDPSRWLKSDESTGQNEAYFPFGAGHRTCIGSRMAMMETKIILCQLMQKFSVRRLSDKPVEVEAALSTAPKGGLKLQFIPRTS